MGVAEALQPRHQPAHGEGADHAQGQHRPALEARHDAAQPVDGLAHGRRQRLALLGEGEAAGQPPEVDVLGATPLEGGRLRARMMGFEESSRRYTAEL